MMKTRVMAARGIVRGGSPLGLLVLGAGLLLGIGSALAVGPPPPVSILTATQIGSEVTLTAAAAGGFADFADGDKIEVTGVSEAGYDGVFTVLDAVDVNTLTYTHTTGGLSPGTGGTVTNSCIGTSACTNVAGTVGPGSCNADFACARNPSNLPPVEPTNIGAGSCNGITACSDLLGSVGDRSCNSDGQAVCSRAVGPIGNDSCNGEAFTCQDAPQPVGHSSCNGFRSCFGYTGGPIGDNACNSDDVQGHACYNAAGPVGDDSCNGRYACDEAGGPVGANSCVGDYVCQNPYPDLFTTGSVGDNSCIGNRACNYADPIGANSCVGDHACYWAYSVGAGSCNGYYACYSPADPIGTNSCNGDQACYESASPVGDCENNLVAVPACVADVPAQIAALAALVSSYTGLDERDQHKLIKHLDKATRELDKGHPEHACRKLSSFIKAVGKKKVQEQLTQGESEALIDGANAIKDELGC